MYVVVVGLVTPRDVDGVLVSPNLEAMALTPFDAESAAVVVVPNRELYGLEPEIKTMNKS